MRLRRVGCVLYLRAVIADSPLRTAMDVINDAQGRVGPTYTALTFAIGRCAQLHVDSELVLRGMVTTFVHLGLIDLGRKRPRGFTDLLPFCEVGVRNADLPAAGQAAALDVLADGYEVSARRDRVVHDRWVQRSEAEDDWLQVRLWRVGEDSVRGTESDLAYVAETLLSLERYVRRLRVTFDFLMFNLPGLSREWTVFENRPLDEAIAVMRG
jgi:hypothetical protein